MAMSGGTLMSAAVSARTVRQAEGLDPVRALQRVLYRSAKQDPGRRFHALFDKVARSDVMVRAWNDVAANRGAPGVDGVGITDITAGGPESVRVFLDELAGKLRSGSYRPQPLRRGRIPKPGRGGGGRPPGGGESRPLGTPTVADRVVMAAAKLVLEPIFEADFSPVSFGFRPKRSAHDAIAEIQLFGTHGYRWVLDADIEACFDRISHTALLDRVRARVKDKRVVALVKAFLKAGLLTELGEKQDTPTGTPQGGILTPPTQLAMSACSVLRVGIGA